MSFKKFSMKKCPWQELKETDEGTLYWCEKCGSIYNEDGDWEDNGPTFPLSIDTDTLYCEDRGLTP